MTLNVSLDGGSSWSVCTPGLIDFEQYPALRLRFVDAANEEELPSWIDPRVLSPKECAQRPHDASIDLDASLDLDASIHNGETNARSSGKMEC
jgi:hypothetical protein